MVWEILRVCARMGAVYEVLGVCIEPFSAAGTVYEGVRVSTRPTRCTKVRAPGRQARCTKYCGFLPALYTVYEVVRAPARQTFSSTKKENQIADI